mgnify:CR=1 FL=1
MPVFEVEVAPGLIETVEANNASDARKIVKGRIAKGVVSPIYDELYFDYETGVDDLKLRRLLARAETLEEKEQVLRNLVGSSGYIKTTDKSLALTPKGLKERGLPIQTRTLQDGSVLQLNTIIEGPMGERGDLADFMGVAGPIIGSVAGVLPQSKIFKAAKALAGGSQLAGRVLGGTLGGGLGKGGEEVADAIQGFQLEDSYDLFNVNPKEGLGTITREAGLSAAGEGLSLLGGGLWRMYFGAKAPSAELRLARYGADKLDLVDLQRLDADLGKQATRKQILDAVKAGKIKKLDDAYRTSLANLDMTVGGKTQAIAEAVIGVSRSKSNVPYLSETFDNLTSAFRKRGSSLNAYVDNATADKVTDSVNVAKKELEKDTTEAVKISKELVEDLTNSYIGVENFKDAPAFRDYGEFVLDTLGNAKGAVNREVGLAYDALDRQFFDLGANPNSIVARAIDDVIRHYQREGLNKINYFKARNGFDEKMTLSDPNININVRNVLEAEEDFKRLLDKIDPKDFAGNQPFGKLTRVLETKRDLEKFLKVSTESKEADLFYTLSRLLDDYDLHAARGEVALRKLDENADSIFTMLGLRGGQVIKNVEARTKADKSLLPETFEKELSNTQRIKINNAIEQLREANELAYRLNKPFDDATIKKITRAARGRGAYDADDIFKDLIYKGSARQLEDFFKALQDFDDYLLARNDFDLANNFERAKSQTLQRLFKTAFDNSVDPVTDTIDYSVFAKYIKKFETDQPGKLDVLLRNEKGISSGGQVVDTINQLVKLAPKLKPSEVENLADTFLRLDEGLSVNDKGKAFALALREQARKSANEQDFLANKNLSDLPNKTPDEIVDTIFRPNNDKNILRLREIMNEEDFAKVQEASLGKLLKDAIDFDLAGNPPITDIFKAGNLNTALTKYSKETLEAMFSKEFATDIKHFANVVDVLTKGEVGRGNFAGALIAAGIAASVVFAPLQALPTVLGLFVVRSVLGRPGAIKFFTKTDKGSIMQLMDITGVALQQAGVRAVAGGFSSIAEETEKAVTPALAEFDVDQFIQETRPQVERRKQPSIPLPDVLPVGAREQLKISEDRRQFAEDLFRRPVI